MSVSNHSSKQNSSINYCSEQMQQFFKDYLIDISSLINHIKLNVYSMINLNTKNVNQLKLNVNADISSILGNCKKTFDDLKRVDSLIEGYVKSRQNKTPLIVRNKSKTIQNNITSTHLNHQNLLSNEPSRIRRGSAIRHQDMENNFNVSNSSNIMNQEDKIFNQIEEKQRNMKSRINYEEFSPLIHNRIGDDIDNQLKDFEYKTSSQKPYQRQEVEHKVSYKTQRQYNRKSGLQNIKKNIQTDQKEQWKRINTMYDKYSYEQVNETQYERAFQKNKEQMSDILGRNSDCIQLIRTIKKELSKKIIKK